MEGSVLAHSLIPLLALSLCSSHKALLYVVPPALVLAPDVVGFPNVGFCPLHPLEFWYLAYLFSQFQPNPCFFYVLQLAPPSPPPPRLNWFTVSHVAHEVVWRSLLSQMAFVTWCVRVLCGVLIFCHFYCAAIFHLPLRSWRLLLIALPFYTLDVS